MNKTIKKIIGASILFILIYGGSVLQFMANGAHNSFLKSCILGLMSIMFGAIVLAITLGAAWLLFGEDE